MRKARKCGVITGLPDAYGRGRIIGDYRRVALYGIDRLIEEKKKDKADIAMGVMDTDAIRQSEELFQQIAFLQKLKEMASMYGYDTVSLLPMQKRRFSGCILVIWAQLRSKMARQCL